ncbi:SufE family protein [Gynuella sunshinyii]|uniref:SufE protein probably involved in Fe-S center assembly n=1 Tax=Gynuella sunshinyii YC6258 TaxID=1445510 RepID=A0A0C5VRA0_9GAMM|nr:SufE family protein [Gynuella sunshinyii]AJQ96761.1 SufE protein probably involved in Fe-S center assembly [Gynuella sunshinyii YC6258]
MNPFGTEITTDDIVETLSFFDSWEERYKYIIDLGKQIPTLPDELKTEDRLVKGCQSQVWIESQKQDGRLFFDADSDAHIVKGLLGVVLAAFNGKTPEQVLVFDIEKYFSDLDLLRHLSPTRGNGLRAMVKRIQAFAAA